MPDRTTRNFFLSEEASPGAPCNPPPRPRRRLLPLVVLAALFRPQSVAGDPIVLNGEVLQHTEDSGANTSLQQNYNLDVLKPLQLNERMSVTTSVRYSREQRENVTHDIVMPALTWDIDTDLHRLRVAASTNEQLNNNEPDRTYRSLEATWDGGWQRERYIPSVRLHSNQNWTYDHATPRGEDARFGQVGSDLDWEWRPFRVSYAFTGEKIEDLVAGGETRSDEHMARGDYAESFLDNRLQVGFTQQYDTKMQDTTITSRQEGESFLIKAAISQAGASFDNTPENDAVAGNAALTDGKLRDPAVVLDNLLLPSDLLNISLKVDLAQVDLVYLYTVEDISADAGFFVWDLYESTDGVTWTERRAGTAATYRASRRRFEITIGGPRARYLKLVARLAPARKIEFSEVEAWERFQAAGQNSVLSLSQRQAVSTSTGNLIYSVRPDLQLAYNLNYEKAEFSSNLTSTMNNHAGSLRWMPLSDLAATFNSGISTHTTTGTEDIENRYWGVNVVYPPLPTVNLATSLMFNEQYKGAVKSNTSRIFALNLQSALYRDLSASFNTGFDAGDDLRTGITQENLFNQVIVTSRLVPTVLANLDVTVRQDLSGPTADTLETRANLSWRPSDILSLIASVSDERGRRESTLYSLAGNFAPTPKLQFFSTCSYLTGEQSGRLLDLGMHWPLSPYLSFSATGQILINNEGAESWQMFLRLTASYMGMFR